MSPRYKITYTRFPDEVKDSYAMASPAFGENILINSRKVNSTNLDDLLEFLILHESEHVDQYRNLGCKYDSNDSLTWLMESAANYGAFKKISSKKKMLDFSFLEAGQNTLIGLMNDNLENEYHSFYVWSILGSLWNEKVFKMIGDGEFNPSSLVNKTEGGKEIFFEFIDLIKNELTSDKASARDFLQSTSRMFRLKQGFGKTLEETYFLPQFDSYVFQNNEAAMTVEIDSFGFKNYKLHDRPESFVIRVKKSSVDAEFPSMYYESNRSIRRYLDDDQLTAYYLIPAREESYPQKIDITIINASLRKDTYLFEFLEDNRLLESVAIQSSLIASGVYIPECGYNELPFYATQEGVRHPVWLGGDSSVMYYVYDLIITPPLDLNGKRMMPASLYYLGELREDQTLTSLSLTTRRAGFVSNNDPSGLWEKTYTNPEGFVDIFGRNLNSVYNHTVSYPYIEYECNGYTFP